MGYTDGNSGQCGDAERPSPLARKHPLAAAIEPTRSASTILQRTKTERTPVDLTRGRSRRPPSPESQLRRRAMEIAKTEVWEYAGKSPFGLRGHLV